MADETTRRVHACPRCGSQMVRRTTRQGFVEKVLYRFVAMGPYRCTSCDTRFIDKSIGFGKSSTERIGIP